MNGTSETLGDGIDRVIEEERNTPLTPSDAGSTDQYQPESGCEKRRSPRSGEPDRMPSSEMPTEPMRLKRWAESRLSKPRSLVWR